MANLKLSRGKSNFMQVLYLNTNGFSGNGDKKSKESKNKSIAKIILEKIFEKAEPEIIIFSEFDVNSFAGSYVMAYLEGKGYYCVYPNKFKYISERYTSIVLTFVKEKISSTESLGLTLKWNEILYHGYRIIGVHIPDSKDEYNRAINYWKDITVHYQKHKKEKVLYIGDMNVFNDESDGKRMLNKLLIENAKDGWIEKGHTNNNSGDYTFKCNTRIDYVITSQEALRCVKQIENFQEFFQEKLSDHSALLVDLE